MLDRFHRLGRRLWRWRLVLWAMCVLAALAVPAAALARPGEEGARLVLLALAALMWAICLLMTTYGFSRPLPVIEAGAGWLTRLQIRCRRFGLRFAALLTAILTLLVAYTSARAIFMLLRGG